MSQFSCKDDVCSAGFGFEANLSSSNALTCIAVVFASFLSKFLLMLICDSYLTKLKIVKLLHQAAQNHPSFKNNSILL